MGNAALGYGNRSVAYFYVAADADLSGKDYVVAYVRGAGQAYLGAKQRVTSDGAAVTDVNHIVNFCSPADASFADAGTVDAGVGLNLNFTV